MTGRTAALLLTVLTLLTAAGQEKPDDRAADPPSTVRRRRPDPGKAKAKPQPEEPQPEEPRPKEPPSGNYFEEELTGYGVGHLTRRDTFSFSNRIVEKIRQHISSGQELEKIVVRGYADSIPNSGIKYDLKLLPLDCQREIEPGLIDNPRLAYLRGCLVWNSLRGILEPTYAGGVAWSKTGAEYREKGEQGPQYRKVAVEVYFR